MPDLTLVAPPSSPPHPNGSTVIAASVANGTALPTPLPIPSTSRIRLTKRDLAVVALSKIGLDEDTIATRLKTDIVRVQASLLRYFRKQLDGSEEMVALRVNSMTLDRLEQVDLLIKEGLSATRAILDAEGKEIGREPDIATRTKMAHLLREWKQAVTPKTPLIAQTLNQNNQQNNFNSGRSRSFEFLVREAEERHKLEAGQSPKIVEAKDAEFEEDSPLDEEVVEGDELEEEFDNADTVDEE
jgi:hypothetical protein